MYNNINVLGYGYLLIKDRSQTTPKRAFWRIYWNPTPGGYVEFQNKKYYIDKSKIVAIPPGISVSQGMYMEFESLHIHLDAGRFLASCNEIITVPVSGKLLEKLELLVSVIEPNIARSSKTIDPYMELSLYYVIYSVFSEIKKEYIEMAKPEDERVNICIDKMHDSLSSGITNAELAKSAGMSTNSFIRFFKGETGRTPQAFLQFLRLEESTILLTCTYKTIDEISEECGFCERSYFSRLFKREYGLGPAGYRKQTSSY